jgi:hypothetical protein
VKFDGKKIRVFLISLIIRGRRWCVKVRHFRATVNRRPYDTCINGPHRASREQSTRTALDSPQITRLLHARSTHIMEDYRCRSSNFSRPSTVSRIFRWTWDVVDLEGTDDNKRAKNMIYNHFLSPFGTFSSTTFKYHSMKKKHQKAPKSVPYGFQTALAFANFLSKVKRVSTKKRAYDLQFAEH